MYAKLQVCTYSMLLLLICGCCSIDGKLGRRDSITSNQLGSRSKILLSEKLRSDIESCNRIVVQGFNQGQLHRYEPDLSRRNVLLPIAKAMAEGCFTGSFSELGYGDIVLFLREEETYNGWELDEQVQIFFYSNSRLIFDINLYFDVDWDEVSGTGNCRFSILISDDIELVSQIEQYDAESWIAMSGTLSNEWNAFLKQIILKE